MQIGKGSAARVAEPLLFVELNFDYTKISLAIF